MTTWNLEETESLVKLRFGNGQLKLINSSLRSISDRQIFAGYHYHEHKKLLKEHIDDKLTDDNDLLKLVLFPAFSGDLEYQNLLMKVSASVIGCLQNMHCIADTLSHVVYYSLGLNLRNEALQEKNISIKGVKNLLNRLNEFHNVHDELQSIVSYPDFLYLEALVNHSKHRSIIPPKLFIDTDIESGTHSYAFSFPKFEYNQTIYDSRETEDFLQPLYKWLSFKTVDVGNAINASLSRQ